MHVSLLWGWSEIVELEIYNISKGHTLADVGYQAVVGNEVS